MNKFSFPVCRFRRVISVKIKVLVSNKVGSVAAGYLPHWTKGQ